MEEKRETIKIEQKWAFEIHIGETSIFCIMCTIQFPLQQWRKFKEIETFFSLCDTNHNILHGTDLCANT